MRNEGNMGPDNRALRGYGVSPGVVAGTITRIQTPPGIDPKESAPGNVEESFALVSATLEEVALGLEKRAGRARKEGRSLIEASVMMARDAGLRTAILGALKGGAGPTRAVAEAVGQFTVQLEALGGYMADRKSDLEDIRDRVIARLRGLPEPGIPALDTPAILCGQDLSPTEAASLDPKRCLGILTSSGGPTGHTAILAAQLGIPAVVQVKGLDEVPTGTNVVFDGERGEVLVAPSPEQINGFLQRANRRAEIIGETSGPGRTQDGHAVALMGNIGTVSGAIDAALAGVEGVGLFRTEFLFMDREVPPTVEEQACTYRKVFSEFSDQRVVVRTLDVGADKPLPFANQNPEENPALGHRGIRLSMTREDLLDQQLEAIAIAASQSSAKVQVMAPMIATIQEAAWFANKAAGHSLTNSGIMVEVPAAAVSSKLLCSAVDFVSIGTNDLSQYAMAADRLEGDFAELLDPWQPALLGLVRLTCEGAATANKPVGVCGEAAADPALALVLVGLGVTSLSMVPALIPGVRAALILHTRDQCVELSQLALASSSPSEARAAVLAAAAPELADII